MRLRVRIFDSSPRQTRLLLTGELDLSTVQILKDSVEKAIHGTAEEVVLDFSELRYLGSCGVRVIIKMLDDLQARGRRLAITGAQGPVKVVLQMLGLTYLVRQTTAPKRRTRRSAEGDGGR
jgi:anti-anti-sigma factor